MQDILKTLADAAVAGGAIALPFFKTGAKTSAAVNYKHEGSPVTEADIAVDRYLEQTLRAAFPDYGWLSEESVDDPARLTKSRVIIVDPIDGTRGFVAGDDTWCVSIGLVEDGRPIAGVLFAPARQELYTAAKGHGAWLNGKQLPIVQISPAPHRIAGSIAVAKAVFGEAHAFEAYRKVPSLAYRLILTATATIDIATATKSCHDWDIAAAEIILSESGISMAASTGEGLCYNRATPVHPSLLACAAALWPSAR